MNSPTWNNLFVDFNAKYSTAQNANSYTLDDIGNIYYYDNSTSSLSWLSGPSTYTVTAISASVDGTLTAVDSTGTAYIYSGATWASINAAAVNTAIGDATHYVIAESSGAITKYVNGTTTTVSSSGGPTKLSTTASLGQIYGVDESGTVYQRTGTSWTTISGKTLTQVNVSLSANNAVQICGVDASGNGWKYNGTVWSSITKPTGAVKFVSLEAGAGYIWATDGSGALYQGTF